MTRQLVASREYKVMLLDPSGSPASEHEARRAVDGFWADVGRVLERHRHPDRGLVRRGEGAPADPLLRHGASGASNGRRYIFRERIDVDERRAPGDAQVPPRRPLRRPGPRHGRQGEGDDAETKFEEDVKPPFVSVFSYSTTVKVDADRRVRPGRARWSTCSPAWPTSCDDVDRDATWRVVDDFCARELVLVGASVLLGKRGHRRRVRDGHLARRRRRTTPPVCVEFSFKYGDDDEDYRGSVARDAHDVLAAPCTATSRSGSTRNRGRRRPSSTSSGARPRGRTASVARA